MISPLDGRQFSYSSISSLGSFAESTLVPVSVTRTLSSNRIVPKAGVGNGGFKGKHHPRPDLDHAVRLEDGVFMEVEPEPVADQVRLAFRAVPVLLELASRTNLSTSQAKMPGLM